MKDIVMEIRNVIKDGELKSKEGYFRKATMISRDYFNNAIIDKYPNVVFIRIFTKKITFIPTFS